jgi:hypothetical protein
MVPKGGLEPPRVTSHAPQTCASASSATSAKGEKFSKVAGIIAAFRIQNRRPIYFVAAGDAAGAAGEVAGAACDAAGDASAAGDGVGVAAGAVSGVDSRIERAPLNTGKLSVNAISMNAAAAPIVIFAKRLAVPRGPNAVLETVFEKSAPASALPGCSRITTTRMMHARMNSP